MADQIRYKSPLAVLRSKIPSLFVILVVLAGLYFWQTGQLSALMKGRVQQKVELPNIADIGGKQYAKIVNTEIGKDPLPSGDELAGKMFFTVNVYDWHTNIPFLYAAGGERTLESSYFGREGLTVKVAHQDDTNVSIKQFLEKAAEWKNSGGKSGGNIGFTVMGNMTVALIEPVQKELKKLDPSYQAIGVDLVGKSDGEDQVIAPVEWSTNPNAMRGKTIVCVYDDGDCALMYKFADQVGVPVNFDYHTYNPNALNIENVSDFILAGKVFIQHRKLNVRPVVDDNGKRTGKTTADLGTDLYPDAVASWTPVDRNILVALSKQDPARLKGLVTLTSTGRGEERKVMPSVLVVFKPWADQNADKVTKLVYATHKAALQLDKYPDAMQRAMQYATVVLGVWDGVEEKKAAEERVRAFHGYPAPQNPGLKIGGSAVFSFQDAMRMLGMEERGDDIANSTYASVYRTYGDLVVRKFPEKEVASYTPFEKFFDPRYLRAAYERAKNEDPKVAGVKLVATRDFSKSQGAGAALGSTSFSITYRIGSAELSPAGLKTMREIQDNYAGSEYHLAIVGHTDKPGGDTVNIPLSRARADTAKAYLVKANPTDFPAERITTDGRGSTEPPRGVDPDYKGACDACRRVEIVISK